MGREQDTCQTIQNFIKKFDVVILRIGKPTYVVKVDICVFNATQDILHKFLGKVRGALKPHGHFTVLNFSKGSDNSVCFCAPIVYVIQAYNTALKYLI